MSGLTFVQKPLIHMGLGYVLAEAVQSVGLQNYTASRIGFIVSGCITGVIDTTYDTHHSGVDHKMANWVHQTFNNGQIDPNSKKTLLAAAFALSFFTNFALFIVTGNYRSFGNVALMTALNFVTGCATTELLKSKKFIS
ncbi:hypothetical protein [Simkania sp.]|uniref:hypothetical protein n=1 Tax=Simkania sp. TaxID=34094 RepID=UPI003B51C8B0